MKFIVEIIIMLFFAIVISGSIAWMIPERPTGNNFIDMAINVLIILFTIYSAQWITNKIMKKWKGKSDD